LAPNIKCPNNIFQLAPIFNKSWCVRHKSVGVKMQDNTCRHTDRQIFNWIAMLLR